MDENSLKFSLLNIYLRGDDIGTFRVWLAIWINVRLVRDKTGLNVMIA